MASVKRSRAQDHWNDAIRGSLLRWFAAEARDLPWRRTGDPYAVWISEIMLQQTQVRTVIPYWERWMRELPGIEQLARARPEKVLKLWEGLGYYTRARNLQRAAQQIMLEHGGQFPRDFASVLNLPGIGRYTAGAICSIAYNQPAPVLDGNVIRVLTRFFAVSGDPKEKRVNARLWRLAEGLVAEAAAFENGCSHLNQALMELGALVCTPRSPDCQACPLQRPCRARQKNCIHQLPNLGRRIATTRRRFIAVVIEREGRFLVGRRPPGAVNAGFWEFPNFEVTGEPDLHDAACERMGVRISSLKPLCRVHHSITRYRIQLDAFTAALPRNWKRMKGSWKSIEAIEKLPFATAHRRILKGLSRVKTNM